MKKAARILVVDDEASILKSLRREIRLHCPECQLALFESPVEALEKIEDIQPWIVVSDKRMMEMGGREFLGQVRDRCPQAIRVLLTGDTTKDVALDMASEAHIVISKPYEKKHLIDVLNHAFCLQQLPLAEDLRKQLGAIVELPVLPKTYLQLTRLLANDEVSTQRVAEVIAQEPAILAKLMQMANSAFLGYSSTVSNPHEVVMRLGLDLITRVVLTLGTFRQCSSIDQQQREQLLGEAFTVAELCSKQAACNGANRKELDDAYAIGMLHNIGCLVTLTNTLPGCKDGSMVPRLEDVTGAYLLSLWEFDTHFVYGLFYQHDLQSFEGPSKLAVYLNIANQVLAAQQKGSQVQLEDLDVDQALLSSLGILEGCRQALID